MMLLFYFLKIFSNFLFFKVFNSNKFVVSDFSLFFFLIFIMGSIFFFLLLVIYKLYLKIFREIFIFFRILYLNFLNFWFRYIVSLFLELILFIYRLRFFFLIGSSYYDPLTKIFFDNLSSLKGEFIMDFYNFSSKYLFENDFNVPLSIFNKIPLLDSSKNVFYVKTFSRFFLYFLESQIRLRSFFFFKQNTRKAVHLYPQIKKDAKLPKFTDTSLWFLFLEFFSLRFFSFLMNFFSHIELIQCYLYNFKSFSLLKIFFIKYFTILKNSFIFILVNLENDSFIHYIHITLYKMALQRYYNKDDWRNLINTYNFSITNSIAFYGDSTGDYLFFLRITLAYLFIYLNLIIYYFLFILFFIFWILYYSTNLVYFIFGNNFVFLCNLSFFFNFFNLIFLYYYNSINFLFLYCKHCYIWFKKIFLLIFKKFNNSFFVFYIIDFSTIFYILCLYFLHLVRILWTTFLSLSLNRFLYFIDLIKSNFHFIISKQLFDFFFSVYLSNFKLLKEKRNSLFSKNFISYEIPLIFKQHKKEEFFFIKLLKEFVYLKLFMMYFNGSIKVTYSNIFLFFRILFFRILCWFFFWSSIVNLKHDILFNALNLDFLHLVKRIKLFLFLNLRFDCFLLFCYYYFGNLINFFYIFGSKKFIKLLTHFIFLGISICWTLLLKFIFGFFYLLFLLIFYLNLFVLSLLVFFFLILISMLFYNFFIFKFFLFLFSCFFLPLLFILFKLIVNFWLKIKINKFFFVFFYFSLFLKIFCKFCLFYFRTFLFLSRRNIGFFQILSIFFLVRNDLKKYELIHSLNSANLFNSVFVDFFLDNFFTKYQNNLLTPEFFGVKTNYPDIIDFSKFKVKMNVPYKNLKRFMNSKKIEKSVEFKSDLFSEFEYHKYLRSRNMRNLRIFRFKKVLEPLDFYNDSKLDDLKIFNSKTNNFSNFDFLKIFYNDDFMFLKDLKYFRDTFSRRNLSFFYDNLDKLSNFRLRYNKISPLFRYFYLKRERLKYILTLYTYGNINTFSFSIISNWILNYRILRSILLLIINFDYTLMAKNKSTDSISSRFFLFTFLASFDKFFIFINYLCLFFLFIILFIFFYSFIIDANMCFFIFFLFVIFSFRNFLLFYNLHKFVVSFYDKPFFMNIKTLVFSFFSLFSFNINSRFNVLFFFFQKIYLTNFGIFFRFFFFFIISYYLFNFLCCF